jgi:hypothetical protein
MWQSREYRAWHSMKGRCNPKNKRRTEWHTRGIKICPEWAQNFASFFANMGVCPPGHTLDRINTALTGFCKVTRSFRRHHPGGLSELKGGPG